MQKPKKCKICGTAFSPRSSMAKVCSVPCSLRLVERTKAKASKESASLTRKRVREYRKKTKTLGQWTKDAQAAFNEWVRERDYGLPCISCGLPMSDDGLLTGSRIDAGHYRSRGACPELRFHPANVHAQCVRCNQHLSGNIVEYRKGLIERIGLERVEWIEGHHEMPKYTRDDLEQMTRYYRAEARRLRKARQV